MFDREAVFIETVLTPLLERMPDLRVVLEHITTKQAAEFVASAPSSVAATVTPQHMLYNRNALFQVCHHLLAYSFGGCSLLVWGIDVITGWCREACNLTPSVCPS